MGLSEEKNPLLLRLLFYFPQSFITGRFGRYLHLSALSTELHLAQEIN